MAGTKRKRYAGSSRENFMKMYNRTCDRVFGYAFECTLNRADAELITRNAYVNMYQNLSQLRHSSSLDAWQRENVRQAFRALIRSNRLSMVHEKEEGESPEPLTALECEELWNAINKFGSIDAWRLVPIPGKTSALTVLTDRYISDLSGKSVADIAKIVLIGVGTVVAVVALVYLGVRLIGGSTEVRVDAMQEIFPDERSFAVSSRENASVDYDALEDMVESAENAASWEAYQSRLESIANMSSVASAEYVIASSDPLLYAADVVSSKVLVLTSAEGVGLTIGTGTLTGDAEIDTAIAAMIAEIDLQGETDFEIIGNIYEYVGSHIVYTDEDTSSLTENDYIKFYLLRGAGDSRHYAAVLSAVLNACGYQSEVVSGYFVLNSATAYETNVKHYWNKVILNGMEYYLDLEADCNANGTQIRGYYFMAARGNSRWDIFERDHVFQ